MRLPTTFTFKTTPLHCISTTKKNETERNGTKRNGTERNEYQFRLSDPPPRVI